MYIKGSEQPYPVYSQPTIKLQTTEIEAMNENIVGYI